MVTGRPWPNRNGCWPAFGAELERTPAADAVLLTQAENLPHAEVARQLGISQEELQRRDEHADAYLRARLSELGVGSGEARGATRRNALPAPRAPADDSLEQAFDRVGRETTSRRPRAAPSSSCTGTGDAGQAIPSPPCAQ